MLSRRQFFRTMGVLSAASFSGLQHCGSHKKTKPNILFILVDDLGYMDIGANNPDTFYETPNIDQLARQGMRFTHGYAACPVCSPTRYSIMTGKYPSRVDATNYFSGKRQEKFAPAPLNDRMPLNEVTLAEALRQGGYQTAFVGKWHLGPTEEYWPKAQGFDVNIGGHHRGMPKSFFSPYKNPKLDDGPKGEYLTKRLTDETLDLIERFREKPFFLYLSFYTVHIPLQAPEDLIRKYREKAKHFQGPEFAQEDQYFVTNTPRKVRIKQNHPVYAAMVEAMDQQVGRVLKKLDELGLSENTLVCFMSDNGGLSTAEGSPTSNLPLRGGKGWMYDGGIREPWIIKWPDQTAPHSVCDIPVTSTDFYPTLLEAAGLPLRPEQHLDGKSLVPLLRGKDSLQERTLFWHYPHYSNQGGFPAGAVRKGDYKLIENLQDGEVCLYNLIDDISEQNDLAKKMPEKVNELRTALHAWYKKVDAKFLRAREGGPAPWKPE